MLVQLMGRGGALFIAAVLAVGLGGQQAHAGYTWEVLGGELEVAGFADAEARVHTFESGGSTYLNQLITRLQVEATITWEEVGFFDEISLTTVVRPQFDWAHYYGDSLGGGHVGRDADEVPADAVRFRYGADPIGFGGFDFAAGRAEGGPAVFATGGLEKTVLHGVEGPGFLEEFATLADSNFPLTYPLSDRNLNCGKCQDVDDDHLDVAFGATDSNGRLYPIRELYADLRIGDVWFRIGKQQIVWGKTDFFRLQDVINPVDFGQHFFFDSFEDIRIPQWMMSVQWRPGSIGPFTDTAIQLIWNFDRFQRVGGGAPYQAWAFDFFGRQIGTFALFNTYFSPEPCAPGGTDFNRATPGDGEIACGGPGLGDDPDGFGAGVTPSGFGTPAGLRDEKLPAWKFDNTEIALRLEARIWKIRFALTNHYGWWDAPALHWQTVTLNNGVTGLGPVGQNSVLTATDLIAAGDDTLWVDRAAGIGLPVFVGSPEEVVARAATSADPTVRALAGNAFSDPNAFYGYCPAIGTCLTPGASIEFVYDKVNTLGLAVDYFDDFTGIVFRLESSWSNNVPVSNKNDLDWLDSSDLVQFALGMDRPTFIKFLNPTRTFFISSQIFHTYWMDYEGDNQNGMIGDRHNWIYTLFIQGQYMRDRLTPQGFIVFEQSTGAWISGFQLQYLLTNNWSVLAGVNVSWGTPIEDSHAIGPFTAFTIQGQGNGAASPLGDSTPTNVQGAIAEGLTVLRDQDEIFFRIRYAF
ncbi:MAG: hypothetical protein HKP27_01555 [Myxococcales bacterium]|nr:hypothetical protein [Myxococcales bacterium]